MNQGNLHRARLLLEQGRYKEAKENLGLYLLQHPDDVTALRLLVACDLQLGAYKDALDKAKSVLGLEPDSAFSHLTVAEAYFVNNQREQAKRHINQGLAIQPFLVALHQLKSTIALHEDRWADGLQAAEKGLELAPEDTHLLNLRSKALIQLNRFEEATATLDYSLQNAPDSSATHATRGWALLDRGKLNEAIDAFKESLRLNPESTFAASGLKEAIKGKNPFYRLIQKYFLWMSKLNDQSRWAFIIGIYVFIRVLGALSERYPDIQYFTTPIIVLYIVFALSTWIAQPLSNLFLRFHRVGKFALTPDERRASNFIAVLIVLGLGLLAGSWFVSGENSSALLFLLGILTVAMMIPVAGMYNIPSYGKIRRNLGLVTVGIGIAGLLGIFVSPIFLVIFGLSILGYGFIANYLVMQENKRFR